ncbi:chromosome segregation protein SMC [Shimazuella sp. AN120528]|uniref:chromosome segregation protein SMC n=1 Tax=Shimazuella soli TaxID=1892854 RepID=UPI001F1089CC|nr:chromosome segregation protein SMC [Shimazuella soli]MCH5584973.1 chromosome segregation protein SMC [Shimazuella soli]
MHLKRLEMSGFKSFASRTELEFVPGITAVVGPNGSGKSNVTDAIRWVLGEQSAKSLRGTKMEDVIFVGSDSRKPVGFCEVSITLDNTKRILPLDYAEVTVTRRVYRSGDSEYLLNRQACRLKDIQELFMDTGIGKEAYSMIGQGRIEEMISNKSEDRRAIFEEAAGIVKYKSRKKEAEKKLADAEQNLVRIRDLIHELRNQLEPLQKQAEHAQQFKAWQQELTEVEISFYVHKIETLHEEWTKTSQLVKQLKEQHISGASKQSKEEAELAQVKFQLVELEKKWEILQSELLDTSEKVEKADAEKQVWQERTKNRAEMEEKLQEQLKAYVAEYTTSEKERLAKQQQHQAKKLELSTLQDQMKAIKFTANQEIESEVSSTQIEWEKIKNEQVRDDSEKKYILNQCEEIEQEFATYQQEKQILNEEKKKLEQISNEIEQQIDAVEAELELKTTKANIFETEKIECLSEQKNLHNQLLQLEKQLVRIQSERDVLQSMEQNHAGFFQGVKAVLENRSLTGIIGAVAELIQVPKKVEVAMETALGGALQHVVVEDEAAARSAISFLKEKRLGRATFLPINVIKGRSIPEHDLAKLAHISGFLGVADDLVSTAVAYRPLCSQLLGNVLVTDNLATANKVAQVLSHRYRVVTLEGDVVNPGGSMTGGSRQNKTPNLLARSRQLEELNQQVQQWLDKQEKLQADEKMQTERLASLENEWKIIQTNLNDLFAQQKDLDAKKQENQLQFKNNAHRLNLIVIREEESNKKRAQLQQRLREMEDIQHNRMERLKELEVLLEQEEFIRKQQADEERERNTQLTEYRIEEAKLQQMISGLEEDLNRIEEAQQKNLTLQQNTEKEQQKLLEMEDLSEEAWQRLLASLYQHQEAKKSLQLEISELRDERDACSQKHQELEHIVYENSKLLRSYEEKLHQQEVRVNRLDVELNHLLQKLAEEYETSFEGAKEKYGVPENPAQAERKVRSLKQKLEQLGDVNIGAIEEYQRLTERLTFLTTQEDDLLQAKQQLYQMIAQMVSEMGKRFSDNFVLIREEFQDVFVKMFGGGRADLQLTDPNNLLDTGIEIVAQPPGKKLQQLSLLSGGERSLAALALLFAVLRIKPVPFCFLDEVDAALDEANLTRFTHYLQKFANQTQFIIITHRKHTMEGADVLYGITMQESGVSTLVSVKLEEYDESREEVAAAKA